MNQKPFLQKKICALLISGILSMVFLGNICLSHASQDLTIPSPDDGSTSSMISETSLEEDIAPEGGLSVHDSTSEEQAFENHPYEAKTAWLYVLDKTTGKSQTIEAPIGKVIRNGPLRINVCQCYKNDPESFPEARAYLDLWFTQEGEPTEHIFSGWMFASSPSISALEHPSYDVWVKDCQ